VEWLNYIRDEAIMAIERGVPVEGVCLYPIVDYPGWQDDRCRHTGLWGYSDGTGHREIYASLARELARQQKRIERVLSSCPAVSEVEYVTPLVFAQVSELTRFRSIGRRLRRPYPWLCLDFPAAIRSRKNPLVPHGLDMSIPGMEHF